MARFHSRNGKRCVIIGVRSSPSWAANRSACAPGADRQTGLVVVGDAERAVGVTPVDVADERRVDVVAEQLA